MLNGLQDVNDRQNHPLTVNEISDTQNSNKEVSRLYIHQPQNMMPISMLEMNSDANGYMLPVTGYLSQQIPGKTEEFSTSSCVPLIPLSSVLVPVDDGISGGVGYDISPIYETYGCLPSSNQPVHGGTNLPIDMPSSVADNVLMVDAEASMICPVNSSTAQHPTISFVPSESTATLEHYPTNKSSDSPVLVGAPTSAVTVTGVKKKGRPRKPVVVVDPQLAREITVNPETQPYNPFHFWCPVCEIAYTVSECPHHPLSIEHDSPVPTYAKLSLPAGLFLEESSKSLRVMCKRRWPLCTRFGPVIAPSVTEAELQLHPDWLPSCPFRLDPVDSSEPVRYLKLSDESVCNWMMFVRREDQLGAKDGSSSARRRRPNCVAYQFGSAGIFFLTTKVIRPGEELLVTLAPPYASRSHSASVCQLESCDTGKTTICPSQPKKPIVADEIHCFRCTITFDSEEAFRVHCLGHPDESALRGFIDTEEVDADKLLSSCQSEQLQTRSEAAYIRLRKPTIKDITDMTTNTKNETRTVYFRSALQCTLCFTTFQGLSQLVHHTDTAHSVADPRIFKRSTDPTQLLSPTYVGDVTDEIVASNDLDAERLIVKSNSLYDFRGTDPTSVSSAENLLVVDLTNASQNLLEQNFWAYGCGQCKQRFPSMMALEQHKETLHDAANPVNSAVSQQFQLDELLPRPYTESVSAVSTEVQSAQFSTFDFDARQNMDTTMLDNPNPCASPCTYTNRHDSNSAISSRLDPIICSECFKDFRSRAALATHVRSGVCSSVIPSVRVIRSPISQNKVTGLKGRMRTRLVLCTKREFLNCIVCGERFSTRHAWKMHEMKHRRPLDKLYPCELCDQERVYETFVQLRRHVRQVHTNQVFPCPYCNYTFGRRKNLDNHLTRHTGRRDFICPHDGCHKTYSRKDKLKTHMKVHSNGNRKAHSNSVF